MRNFLQNRNRFNSFRQVALSFVLLSVSAAWSQTVVKIQPNVTKSIAGYSVLDRNKYFNLCYSGRNFESNLGNATLANRYVNELEIGFGRVMGLVSGASNVVQDPARPGYASIPYLKYYASYPTPPSNGVTPSAAFSARFPLTIGNMYTDNHNAYPKFMPKEVYPGSTDSIPKDRVAAGELAANVLKYNFTDWTRPIIYEPINEPTYQLYYSGWVTKLGDFHTQVQKQVKALGVPTLVGGPCSSFSAYYNNNYNDFKKLTGFIDATSGNLDFYSFHVYDFHRWDSIQHVKNGRVTSGLPLEGIMDLLAAYGKVNYNKDLKYYTTEHGGTLNVPAMKLNMQKWFLGAGSGFAYDMKAKSITDFLMVNSCISNTMVFMDRPQLVMKAAPFILLESASWDPKYHASILVPNNYTDRKNWFESAQINFYKYFKGVRGRRVLTQCENPDIQQQAYVNGNKLILLLNNLSDSPVTLSLNYPVANLDSLVLRRLARNTDFTPFVTEAKVATAESLTLTAKESVVLFCNYSQPIAESYQVEEVPYYSPQMMVQFSTSSSFNVAVPSLDNIEYAYLRIGVGRGTGTDRNMSVWLNDTKLTVPLEVTAPTLEDASGYGSTKIIQVDKSLLKASNVVKVAFNDGKTGGIGAVTLCVGTRKASSGLSGVSVEPATLYQNYPNPSTGSTTLAFSLINPARASLSLYDTSGREVMPVASGDFQPGQYKYTISTKGLRKGIYFYRLITESDEMSRKMIVE